MTETEKFFEALAVIPRKPEYVGFSMNPEELYKGLLKELNKLAGFDMKDYCSWDLHDEDYQYQFFIDEYALTDNLEGDELEELVHKLPFSIEEYWEITEYLAAKHFGVETWVYVQGRYHDRHTVDVQIGVPRNL